MAGVTGDGALALERPQGSLYYGRGIILGVTTGGNPFAAYFVTGRSASSKARVLECSTNDAERKIATRPTDEKVLRDGNPELLLYDALLWSPGMIAVSNGRQTADVWRALENPAAWRLSRNPGLAGKLYRAGTDELQWLMEKGWELSPWTHRPGLGESTARWQPEPDHPNYTPRINGRMRFTLDGKVKEMTLGIIRKKGEAVEREEFPLKAEPGIFYSIRTYAGEFKKGQPLPPFVGDPRANAVEVKWALTSERIAEAAITMMGASPYHVALAVLQWNKDSQQFEPSFIKNWAKPMGIREITIGSGVKISM